MQERQDMKIFLNVILWIINVFILLSGFGLLLSPDVKGMGAFFVLLGITLLPPLRDKINGKLLSFFTGFSKNNNSKNPNYTVPKVLIGLLKFTVFSFLFIFCIASMPEPQNVNTHSDNIVTTEITPKSKYRNNKNAKLIAKKRKIRILSLP